MLKLLKLFGFNPMYGFVLFGGSDSGGGGSQTSTNYTSNLPQYAQPYYEKLLNDASGELDKPYVPNPNQQIAGFTPMQSAAQQQTANLNTSPNYGMADQALTYGTQQALNTQKWIDPGVAQSYMNPYMQNVTDIQKREAARQAGMQSTADDAKFAQAGAFGGSRHGIVDAERERNLGIQMNDLQAQGLNQAWQQGQQTFGADRSAEQAGINLGMQGAMNLGQNATAAQAADLARIGAVNTMGQQQQALQQQVLDQQTQDFINQRDYQRQNLNFYSGLLHGVPVTAQQNVVQYSPQGNSVGQLAGLGIAGLGAYNAANGSK
jgi:hypothetical protein